MSQIFNYDDEEEKLFSKPKGGSGRFVFRNGKVIPKWQVNEYNDKRSELAAPYVVGDIPEHQNMATGEWVSTRRRHREILRDHKLTEIGNEKLSDKPKGPKVSDIHMDIKETIDQLEQGYVFPPDDSYETEESGVTFDEVEVDVSQPDTPQYVRSNGKSE